MEIKVTVWRVFCVVAIGVFLTWSGVNYLTKIFSGSISVPLAILTVSLAAIAGYTVMRLNDLSTKGITNIPSFIVPLKQSNNLFTLVRDDKEKSET